jgi:hypothetical protein
LLDPPNESVGQIHAYLFQFFGGQEHKRKNPLRHMIRMVSNHMTPLGAKIVNNHPPTHQAINPDDT